VIINAITSLSPGLNAGYMTTGDFTSLEFRGSDAKLGCLPDYANDPSPGWKVLALLGPMRQMHRDGTLKFPG